jgi:predicted TIM-barrel fold metal-dependent hydrolase
MRIIDIHTHAFPDSLAERAVASLKAGAPGIEARCNGTVDGLLRSMDAAGIDASVVASILTKPAQFENVLAWSKSIRSDRIIPFPSVHPASENAIDEVRAVAAEGFLGIKMHPYYQDFILDDEALFPLYEAIANAGLALLVHTGFDLAFPRVRVCDPVRTARVAARFPTLKFIATHLGAWCDWEDCETHIVGKNIYMDVSYALVPERAPRAREMILAHPPGYVLLGSDSPWVDQGETVDAVKALHFGRRLEEEILGKNAERLLGL